VAKIEFDNSPEMARQYWIIEYHGNKPVRILHTVLKDRKEKGAYAELKSLNGFRRRCTLRLSKHYDKDIKAFNARLATDPNARMVYTSLAVWYDVRDSRQWQVDKAVWAGMRDAGAPSELDDVPTVEAGGVFDLYALIGYDHRRDRYHPTDPATARPTATPPMPFVGTGELL
jgi:hypothetical protein